MVLTTGNRGSQLAVVLTDVAAALGRCTYGEHTKATDVKKQLGGAFSATHHGAAPECGGSCSFPPWSASWSRFSLSAAQGGRRPAPGRCQLPWTGTSDKLDALRASGAEVPYVARQLAVRLLSNRGFSTQSAADLWWQGSRHYRAAHFRTGNSRAGCSRASFSTAQPDQPLPLNPSRPGGASRTTRGTDTSGNTSSKHASSPGLSAGDQEAKRATAKIHALTKAGDFQRAVQSLQPDLQASRLALAAMWDAAVVAAAKQREPNTVMHLLQQMATAGVPSGRVANGSAINSLCRAGRTQEALTHLDKLLAAKKATSAMCRMVMTAGMVAGDSLAARAAVTADDELRASSGAPRSADTWAQLIRLRGVEGGGSAAQAAFTEAQTACGALTALHEAFVCALAAAGDLTQALANLEDLLDSMPSPSSADEALPLAAAWSSLRTSVSSSSLASSPATSNTSSNDDVLLRDQSGRSLPRGTQIAAAQVAVAAEAAHDAISARSVVAIVTQAGFDAPALLWNAAVRAAIKGGSDPDTVDNIVEDMLLAGVAADHHTFVAMATAYAAAGDIPRCASVLDYMDTAGVPPQRHAFNAVLAAAAKEGNLQLCQDVYRRMLASQEEPDQATFVAVFSCLKASAAAAADSASWQSAAAMGAPPQLRSERSDEGDTSTLHFEMQRSQEMSAALDAWWQDQQRMNVPLSPALLTSLVQALCHLQRMEEACQVVENAAAGTLGSAVAGESLPPQACAAVLGGCARSGRAKLSVRIRRTMEEVGVPLGVHAYQALISTCAWTGDVAAALTLHQEMQRKDIPPSIWVENALIRVYCLSGNFEGAMKVFRHLPAAGLEPDSLTWHVLMSAAQHYKRADFGAQVLALIPEEERPKWDHRLNWARGIGGPEGILDPLPLYASSDDDDWGS